MPGACTRGPRKRDRGESAGHDRGCYHDPGEAHVRQKGDRSVTDQKTLNVGDQAPSFTLKTIGMKDVSLSDYKGKNIVLFFYPKAMTKGCTIESCGFRNKIDELAKLDTVVIGISTWSSCEPSPLLPLLVSTPTTRYEP